MHVKCGYSSRFFFSVFPVDGSPDNSPQTDGSLSPVVSRLIYADFLLRYFPHPSRCFSIAPSLRDISPFPVSKRPFNPSLSSNNERRLTRAVVLKLPSSLLVTINARNWSWPSRVFNHSNSISSPLHIP